MRQFALPILESYGVDVVLCGHSHSYERSYFLDGHYGLSGDLLERQPGRSRRRRPGRRRRLSQGEPSVPTRTRGAVYVVNGSGSEVRA